MQENLSVSAQNLPPDVKRYNTKEFAAATGLSVRTLEDLRSKRKGRLMPAGYDEKGKAFYTADQIDVAKQFCRHAKNLSPTNLVSLFDNPTNETVEANNDREDDGSNDDAEDVAEFIAIVPPADNDDDKLQDPPDDTLPKTAEAAPIIETPLTIETPAEVVTLDTRANRIRQLQADVQRGIIKIGEELIAAKKEISHGGWADWLKTNFDWTQQTANRFMRVAERFGKLNNVVQFQPSTLQAMLALPEGDEEKFIEAQADRGKCVDDLSARDVQKAVKEWNQQRNSEDTEKHRKIAAVITPCVEEESSEDTPPVLSSFNKEPVGIKFKLEAMKNFKIWQSFVGIFGETLEENQLNKLINLFGEYYLELGKPLTYEKNLIQIAERILACAKEICKQTADLNAMIRIEMEKLDNGASDTL